MIFLSNLNTSLPFQQHLLIICLAYIVALYCVWMTIMQELFGCMCTQTNEDMCTYYFLLCVQWQHTTAITHSHTHTHTHTDGPRAALAVVDWPWKHQVWQTLTNTQISTNTDKHWQTLTNTPNMTTTLTNPNTRNAPWVKWEDWVGPTECLSKYSNTHIQHTYQHFSIHLTHAQTFEHITCKHVSRIAMSLHTNADCLFPLWRHSWCHAMSPLKVCNMNKRGMCRCTACHYQKTAEIIHNELIKPGTNTGNKATKKNTAGPDAKW